MKTYIAKTKHKRVCDLCAEEILVGDRVTTWAWWNPESEPGDGNFGNIMRVHETCNEVEMEAYPRETFSPGDWGEEKAARARERLVLARLRKDRAS